jgi:hypothetical protein
MSMRRRVAFYPCCNLDVAEPLALLRPYAEEIVFCDINARLLPRLRSIARRQSPEPNATFRIGDVREIVGSVEVVDVLFYRRDSPGEGGSGVFVLGDSFLPSLLARFPAQGGLIITDGSNSRGSNFERMTRKSGLAKHGWRFLPCHDQPYLLSHGLHVISVQPVGA